MSTGSAAVFGTQAKRNSNEANGERGNHRTQKLSTRCKSHDAAPLDLSTLEARRERSPLVLRLSCLFFELIEGFAPNKGVQGAEIRTKNAEPKQVIGRCEGVAALAEI